MRNIINRIMMGDSYKYSHSPLYPDANNMFDYIEARSTNVYDSTLWYGLQGILKEYFTTPITQKELNEAQEFAKFHGIPFDYNMWSKIVKDYNGFIPVIIKAVPEGTLVPNKNVLASIELSTPDEEVFPVVSWMETFLMKVWYTCNVATRSFYVKKALIEMGKLTSEEPFVDFQYHNFGDRGSSSVESAYLGGAAHLTCFKGTDNFHTIKYINDIYGDDKGTIGYSIPASEHSTVTSWGKENEFKMVMNHLEVNKGKPLIAAVGDSYDIYTFTEKVTSGEFKFKIESPEYPMLVIRPDSGNPKDVILNMLHIMESNKVDYDINKKGYKVWRKYRIIWGDGIDEETIRDILTTVILKGYSTENISFGSGGWLMQVHNRDTLGFAIKCSNITLVDGTEVEVFKDPITDKGKKSKKGKLTLAKNRNGVFRTVKLEELNEGSEYTEVLKPIFINGKLENELTFEQIRAKVNKSMKELIG